VNLLELVQTSLREFLWLLNHAYELQAIKRW
jgi:hypothetical protein